MSLNKILVNDYGNFLGSNKTDFVVRKEKKTVKKMPFHEVSEIVVPCGNAVSANALFWASTYNIDMLLTSPSGNPIATLMPLKFNSHVRTRMCQYEAYRSRKGVEIAKQFVLGRIETQSQMLLKHKLQPFDSTNVLPKERIELLYGENPDSIRNRLQSIEVKYTQHYLRQISKLFPRGLRTDIRNAFRAYEPLNNLFNLSYEVLSWKCFRAIIKAKLEPYLGFLHSIQENKPSLVCDFQELYRAHLDDFLIDYTKTLKPKDFKLVYGKAKSPRMFLKYPESSELTLNRFFEKRVNIQRIKKYGKSQTLETLMNEEAILLAMYLRDERPNWKPRIPTL